LLYADGGISGAVGAGQLLRSQIRRNLRRESERGEMN
jgi:hypothetical protein